MDINVIFRFPLFNMSSRRGDVLTLDELLSYIDLTLGCFTIGFKKSTGVWTGDGTSDVSDSVKGVGGLMSLVPKEFMSGMADNVLRSFKYTHCEPAFYLSKKGKSIFGEDRLLCVRCEKKTPVQIYARRFHGEYTWVNVCANINEIRGVIMYCCSIQGARFNDDAMYRCMTSPGPDVRKTFYCSYLCASLLEFLDNPVGHLNRPNTLTIDDLHLLLNTYKPEHDIHAPESFLDHVYGTK